MASIDEAEEMIREAAAIMESFAKGFPPESMEVKTLKRCMLAYAFALMRYGREFESYLENLNREPTNEELESIKPFFEEGLETGQ